MSLDTDHLKQTLETILGLKLTQEEFEDCLRNLSSLGQALHEFYLLQADNS